MSISPSRSLRPKAAAALLGISTATLYRWQNFREDMPKGRKLSTRTTVFDHDELLAWRDSQPMSGSR